MGDLPRMRRRRLALWKADPRCRSCGVVTVLPNGERDEKPFRNQATMQHLDSRLSLIRGSFFGTGEERTTLFCWKCNNDDNRDVQAAMDKTELQCRSGAFPKCLPYVEGETNG